MEITYTEIIFVKILYEIVDETVQKYDSQTARIKCSKDVNLSLEVRLRKSGITDLCGQSLRRRAYKYLKNTDVLEEDRYREFRTKKREWDEFYKSLCYESTGELNQLRIKEFLEKLKREKKL